MSASLGKRCELTSHLVKVLYRETQKYITWEDSFLHGIAEYFCDNGGCNLFAPSSNLKLGATLFPNFVQKTGCHFSENFWALSVQFSSFNAAKVCFIFELVIFECASGIKWDQCAMN